MKHLLVCLFYPFCYCLIRWQTGNNAGTMAEKERRNQGAVRPGNVRRLPDNIPAVKWEVVQMKDTLEGSYPVRIKFH